MIDELLDELHGAEVLSKIDLGISYNQIQVTQEDIPKTTFIYHQVIMSP